MTRRRKRWNKKKKPTRSTNRPEVDQRKKDRAIPGDPIQEHYPEKPQRVIAVRWLTWKEGRSCPVTQFLAGSA